MLVCPFVCIPLLAHLCATFILFVFFFGLSVGFVFLLLLHEHTWSDSATSKTQAKKGKCKQEDATRKPKKGDGQ